MVPPHDGDLNAARRLSPAWLIVFASVLFATMGVAVKLASAFYQPGEIVFYRGLVGAVMMFGLTRWHGGTLTTRVPMMHFWRSAVGVASLMLWFYAIGQLPLATAVTLNYMSSVWMALFLIGGAVALGSARIDGRLVAAVLVGFVGVALILRPTISADQLWGGLAGLLSGMLAALAYLQVTALGRAGETEPRIVFYFAIGSAAAGALTMLITGFTRHSVYGAGLLLAVGLLATLAQLLMTRAYSTGRTLVNASLHYLGIVWAFLYGVWLFGDPVTLTAVAGMLLIVAAGLGATMLRSRSVVSNSSNPPTET